jgi:hypothetical protein
LGEVRAPVQRTANSTGPHDVSGLDITVDNACFMKMQHGRQQRMQDRFHLFEIFGSSTGDVLTTLGEQCY